MIGLLLRLATNRSGATAIEYVLIGSLISIAAIAAMRLIGNHVSNSFEYVADKFP